MERISPGEGPNDPSPVHVELHVVMSSPEDAAETRDSQTGSQLSPSGAISRDSFSALRDLANRMIALVHEGPPNVFENMPAPPPWKHDIAATFVEEIDRTLRSAMGTALGGDGSKARDVFEAVTRAAERQASAGLPVHRGDVARLLTHTALEIACIELEIEGLSPHENRHELFHMAGNFEIWLWRCLAQKAYYGRPTDWESVVPEAA
jgi:hypothetical protein